MKRNIIGNLKLAFKAFFHGMKGADEVITQNASYGGGGTEIVQQQHNGGVFDDMLQQKETQQVKETRDAYYRVFKEADKYEVSVQGTFEEGDESDLKATARKKTPADFLKHCAVYNESGYEIRVIQENKFIAKQTNFAFDINELQAADSELYVPLLDIERDDFIPRFKLENYANKIVVRTNGTDTHIDFYTTIYASQFGKVDALFIAEMNRIMRDNDVRSDTVSLSTIRFITDKAYGADDLSLFEYNKLRFEGIHIFDGNFVLTFNANVISDGKDITEKYRIKEMDEKYKKKAPKKDAIDLFTLKRHIDEENDINDIDLGSTTLKLS